MKRVLIVDDDCGMRAALESRFVRLGWKVDCAANATQAMAKFREGMHPLVVSDIRMPGQDGVSLLHSVRQLAPSTAVILLTGYPSVPGAVSAVKDGACEYLIKPVCFEELERAAERIFRQTSHLADPVEEIVGHSPVWLRALDRARQAAASDADVLIEAESGTGKELVARLVHRLSLRKDRPFVAVNCAAFPEALLESELFGYSRGAFTGASGDKPGKFELVQGGTLLLDEVGEMPLSLQPKLLRVLQEREIDRLGGTRSVRVDVRVVATTNRSLRQMVREGTFRPDLYYRLNVIPLRLPPLRERGGDIKELAEIFLRMFSPPGKCLSLTAELLEQLQAHSWPGNVRELANCIRRAVALSSRPEIGLEALEGFDWKAEEMPDTLDLCLRAGVSLQEMERKLLQVTLDATSGNRSRAAALLGVSLRTVRNKVRAYGLPGWSSYVNQ